MTIPTPSGRFVITGGSGFLGRNLARHLAAHECDVHIVSRSRPSDDGPWTWHAWDARTLGPWADPLDGAAGVVNLAGRTVDCVKTPGHCDEILRSRVESTRVLGVAVRQVGAPPPVWAQMSTAHIYGDPPTVRIDEDSAFGCGLAPTVGRAWEGAFAAAVLPEQRGVVLRTSFVVGRGQGALAKLGPLARLGLGGRAGHGRQGISWLHELDMNRIFERALIDDSMSGAYIATAPNPVSNDEFMRSLRRAVGMPIGLPAFAWAIRLAAPLLLRTDPDLALQGRYCVPTRLLAHGFEFEFDHIDAALQDLFG